MLARGTRLDHYVIDDPIAAGGMGVVYRGRDLRSGQRVALKVLIASLALDPKLRARFAQEAWVQSQLSHPGIVRVHQLVQGGGHLAIAMDLVHGPSLEQALISERPGPWTCSATLALVSPLLDAMAQAHARGVVHRDLKPANVLLDRSDGGFGRPVITDFGLAKIRSDSQGLTRTGSQMGTVPYMAPEQFEGRTDIGPPADVFALAMIMHRLLTGALPIDPRSAASAARFYFGEVRLPSYPATANVSRALRLALDGALSMDPAARPRDAGALKRLLTQRDAPSPARFHRTLTPSSPPAEAPARPLPSDPPVQASAEPVEDLWPPRRRGVPAVAMGVGTLALALGAAAWWAATPVETRIETVPATAMRPVPMEPSVEEDAELVDDNLLPRELDDFSREMEAARVQAKREAAEQVRTRDSNTRQVQGPDPTSDPTGDQDGSGGASPVAHSIYIRLKTVACDDQSPRVAVVSEAGDRTVLRHADIVKLAPGRYTLVASEHMSETSSSGDVLLDESRTIHYNCRHDIMGLR